MNSFRIYLNVPLVRFGGIQVAFIKKNHLVYVSNIFLKFPNRCVVVLIVVIFPKLVVTYSRVGIYQVDEGGFRCIQGRGLVYIFVLMKVYQSIISCVGGFIVYAKF